MNNVVHALRRAAAWICIVGLIGVQFACGSGGSDLDAEELAQAEGAQAEKAQETLDSTASALAVRPPRIPRNLWQPPAGSTPQTGNYVYLQSEAGDYIGGGGNDLYTPATAILSLAVQGNLTTVQVTGDQRWTGNFQLPSAFATPQVGYYQGVTRYPFHSPAKGGLDWSGEGRSCNTLSGWFTVDRVSYSSSGAVSLLEMRFEQHCEGAAAALRGKLRWSANDSTVPPGPVNPPPAGLWQAPQGATPATGNYVYLQSDAGDYIGQGSTSLYTNANAALGASDSAARLTLNVNGNQRWTGDFQAMSSVPTLQVGYYGDLKRYPFHNPAKGGLNWSGEGRGCNTLTGWFAVDGVTYTNGTLTSIALRFEQHCEGAPAALRGQIRWSAADVGAPGGPVPPPTGLWEPPAGATPATGSFVYLQSDAGDYIGQGRTTLFTSALLASASDGLIHVGVNGPEYWNGDFKAMTGFAQLQPGYYGELTRYPFHNPAKGGLSWSGQGRGCNTLTGWFVVDSVSYVGTTLQSFEVRFEQHCEGVTPALRGKIRWAAP